MIRAEPGTLGYHLLHGGILGKKFINRVEGVYSVGTDIQIEVETGEIYAFIESRTAMTYRSLSGFFTDKEVVEDKAEQRSRIAEDRHSKDKL